MKVEITVRNCTVSDKLKELAEKKLSKLDKYFDGGAETKAVFKKEGNTLTVEVMLDYLGKLVRATASGDNFYDDLDVVLPKLEGQIRKYRTRFDKNQKNSAFNFGAEFDNGRYEDEKTGKVVKQKQFKLTPMTVSEAAEEMELLGHSFYVFLEAKTGTVQVVYRRNDGDLGLIEPKIQ
ncbi:MAG: ribosome-associated translation inhibitor RaiA [Clostridia bacterium]|nr:ribosome-associated translation inhibitor RaiA [Clostridia bacterium]